MKSSIRDHLMFPGCTFSFWSSMPFHMLILLLGLPILPVLVYLTLLTFDPCWPLKPHTLLLSPYLCAILAASSSSLEQFSEWPCQPTWKAFEMANEPLSPVASLAYDGYVMCSSGLAVVMWTRDRHFLCEQNHSSCFSLGPSSALTTGNCEWKTGMWSTMKHLGMF